MPTLLDLTYKPSTAQPTLPTGTYPHLGNAVYRNDSYSITVRLWSDEAGTVPYVPEGTMAAQIRPARLAAGATPGDPLADFTVNVAGAGGNEVTLSLIRSQAASLPDGWYWDLQEEFDVDLAVTWFTGKGKAWGDVTR